VGERGPRAGAEDADADLAVAIHGEWVARARKGAPAPAGPQRRRVSIHTRVRPGSHPAPAGAACEGGGRRVAHGRGAQPIRR
jgi:hypothetical protein